MIQYNDDIVRNLIISNKQTFGGINSPFTIDLIWLMADKFVTRAINTYRLKSIKKELTKKKI